MRALKPTAAVAIAIAALAAPEAGAGPGSFTTTEVFGGFGAAGVVTGDFDGKNGPDLAVANFLQSGISILLNKGNGTFNPAPINPPITVGEGPDGLWAGRLNGDGALDLVVANSGSDNLTILFGKGDGTFTASSQRPAVGDAPGAIAAGAFDAQAGIDLAVTNLDSGSVSLLLSDGSGNGTFLPSFQTATGQLPVALVAGQFDSTTELDELLVANEGNGTIFPVLATGASPFLAGGAPTAIAAASFNAAPGLDLVVTLTQNAGQARIFQGGGNVTFTPVGRFAVGQGPAAVVAGNLDGGAKADIAVANNGARNVTILLNDGSGDFTQPSTSPQAAGNAPTGIAMSDLNGDGLNDLAVSNYSSGQISIMINDPGSCAGREITVSGTGRRNRLVGTRGRDVIAGRGGNDTIRGLGGADTLCGGPGRDRVLGGPGRDRLRGGPGRDRLHGGRGDDRCRPGAGRDARPRSC